MKWRALTLKKKNCTWPTHQEKYEMPQLQKPRPQWFRHKHNSTQHLDTHCARGHGKERWTLLGQVKDQTGHLPVSATLQPSALKLHLLSPAHFSVPRRPRPLTKVPLKHPGQTLTQQRPWSAYCALMRPRCGMEQSQGKHAGWHCPSARGRYSLEDMGLMWSPTPALFWAHGCTIHGPYQVTTLLVNLLASITLPDC